MIYSYKQLLETYKKEDIEDMLRFNILDIVSRNNIISSFKVKLNSPYPVSDLIKKRKEEIENKNNQKLADDVEKEWKSRIKSTY